MKKILTVIVVLIAFVGAFFLGRLYTLNTLEIIDDHSVQSMGQVHTYE